MPFLPILERMRRRLLCVALVGLYTGAGAQTITVVDRSSLRPTEGAVLVSTVPMACAPWTGDALNLDGT